MADERNLSDDLEEDEGKLGIEREAALALPAVYVDTWFLSTWRGHIRITFGEATRSGADRYRFAMVLEQQDAQVLAKQIQRMLDRREEKDAAPKDDAGG